MEKENNEIQINTTPTLNRALLYTAYPTGLENPIHFSILHHKQTTALQLQVDTKNPLISNGDVVVSMYRNLESCPFCKMFFDIENYKTETCDYRGKFGGLKKSYQKHLVQFCKEKLDFNIPEANKKSQNYMIILGWKILSIEDDLNFFYIQRKSYNKIARVNIVRSVCIQFSTERGLNILNKFIDEFDKKIRKVDKNDDFPVFKDDNNDNFFE